MCEGGLADEPGSLRSLDEFNLMTRWTVESFCMLYESMERSFSSVRPENINCCCSTGTPSFCLILSLASLTVEVGSICTDTTRPNIRERTRRMGQKDHLLICFCHLAYKSSHMHCVHKNTVAFCHLSYF